MLHIHLLPTLPGLVDGGLPPAREPWLASMTRSTAAQGNGEGDALREDVLDRVVDRREHSIVHPTGVIGIHQRRSPWRHAHSDRAFDERLGRYVSDSSDRRRRLRYQNVSVPDGKSSTRPMTS